MPAVGGGGEWVVCARALTLVVHPQGVWQEDSLPALHQPELVQASRLGRGEPAQALRERVRPFRWSSLAVDAALLIQRGWRRYVRHREQRLAGPLAAHRQDVRQALRDRGVSFFWAWAAGTLSATQRLQRAVRAWMDRRHRRALRAHAATTVQRRWRGVLDRKRIPAEWRRHRHRMASVLQRHWRFWWRTARRRRRRRARANWYLRACYAFARSQGHARRWIRAYRRRRAVALLVQGYVRRWRRRRYAAAAAVQATVRGAMTRRWLRVEMDLAVRAERARQLAEVGFVQEAGTSAVHKTLAFLRTVSGQRALEVATNVRVLR